MAPGQPAKLVWIDKENPDHKRQIRAHVQRENHRMKRLQRRMSPKSAEEQSESPEDGSVASDVPLAESGVQSDASSESSGSDIIAAILRGPQDALSTYRRDQLSSLPLGLDSAGQALVDYYFRDMVTLFSSIEHKISNNHFLFPLAAMGHVPFQALVLTFASAHRDHRLGIEESVESIAHRLESVRLLKEAFNDPSEEVLLSNNTIVSVLGMASFENQYGSLDACLTHLKAAMRLIRMRGGPHALLDDPKVAFYANWVDYCASVPQHLNDLTLLSSSVKTVSELAEVDDLFDFLFNVELLSELQQRSQALLPQRSELFQTDSKLHKVLRPDFIDASVGKRRVRRYLRLAALLSVHIALWETRQSPEQGESLLFEFSQRYYENLPYITENTDSPLIQADLKTQLVVWVMMKLDCENSIRSAKIMSGEVENRSTFLARIMRVAKLLDMQSWNQLNSMLFALLDFSTGSVEGLSTAHDRQQWRNRLKDEILNPHTINSRMRLPSPPSSEGSPG